MDDENRESFAMVREDSDYDDKYQISYEKTEQQIETAKEVILEVEKFIKSKL